MIITRLLLFLLFLCGYGAISGISVSLDILFHRRTGKKIFLLGDHHYLDHKAACQQREALLDLIRKAEELSGENFNIYIEDVTHLMLYKYIPQPSQTISHLIRYLEEEIELNSLNKPKIHQIDYCKLISRLSNMIDYTQYEKWWYEMPYFEESMHCTLDDLENEVLSLIDQIKKILIHSNYSSLTFAVEERCKVVIERLASFKQKIKELGFADDVQFWQIAMQGYIQYLRNVVKYSSHLHEALAENYKNLLKCNQNDWNRHWYKVTQKCKALDFDLEYDDLAKEVTSLPLVYNSLQGDLLAMRDLVELLAAAYIAQDTSSNPSIVMAGGLHIAQLSIILRWGGYKILEHIGPTPRSENRKVPLDLSFHLTDKFLQELDTIRESSSFTLI